MASNLGNGDVCTYSTKGDKETVWVAGSGKSDEGKRFCTPQLYIRCFNAVLPSTTTASLS